MPACRRDFQSALDRFLAFNIGPIEVAGRGIQTALLEIRNFRSSAAVLQPIDGIGEAFNGVNRQSFDYRGRWAEELKSRFCEPRARPAPSAKRPRSGALHR